MGLTCGPKCDARARWDLTPAGQALAAAAKPVVIDGTDRDVLTVIARSPAGIVAIARQTGSCNLTARRRIDRLVERGLAQTQDDRFAISDQGLAALGDILPRPAPWLRVEQISAASARDVRERSPIDDRTHWERSRHGSKAAAQAAVTMRLRRRQSHAFGDLDMAG
jgi:hypothetical protein